MARQRVRLAGTRLGHRWASLAPGTRSVVALAGASGLVIVLAAGLVLVAIPGMAGSNSSPTPGIARGAPTPSSTPSGDSLTSENPSASVAATASPTAGDGASTAASPAADDTASPVPSPTAEKTNPPVDDGTPRPTAKPTGTSSYIPCGGEAVVANDLIYAKCSGDSFISAFDPKTGKTVQKYDLPYPADPFIVDKGIWFSDPCPESGACNGPHYLIKIDLQTKGVAARFDGMRLQGDGLGYIWAKSSTAPYDMVRINPGTLETLNMAWAPHDYLAFGCGFLWGAYEDDSGAGSMPARTVLTRRDPTSGQALGTFSEPGLVQFGSPGALVTDEAFQEVAGGCWGLGAIDSETTGAPAGLAADETYWRFIRLSDTGVEARSPLFNGARDDPWAWMGSFWLLHCNDDVCDTPSKLRRLDPTTFMATGTSWTISNWAETSGMFIAGGGVWIEYNESFNRTAIPVPSVP